MHQFTGVEHGEVLSETMVPVRTLLLMNDECIRAVMSPESSDRIQAHPNDEPSGDGMSGSLRTAFGS